MPALERLLKPFRTLISPRNRNPRPSQGGAEAAEITLNHVWSDQPNAIKLQCNRLLVPIGEQRRYDTGPSAADSPLAQALFGIAGVSAVEFQGSYVTVLMDDGADWDAIMESVPRAITKFLKAGGTPVAPGPEESGPKKYSFGFRQVTSRPPEEQKRIVQELLDHEINPAVAAHGGFFSLIDVKDDTVYVQLGGGCQGCGMVDVTLRQGVEQRMRQVLPEMVALVDVTDHASGTDPYYQQAKK